MTDRDASTETTVPYLTEGPITVYVGEDESPRHVPALRYGPWAYVSEHVLATGGRPPKKPAKPGTGRPRTYHVVHGPSGRSICTVTGELQADLLARALFARALTFGSSCCLGDTPDDGEEIRAMMRVVADVCPTANVGGRTARELVAAMSLAVVTDLEVLDDEPEAAA